jgi:CheY-like chemotaxis protein
MVLEDISEDSPLRFSIEEIYRASLRAKDLVKQILTFSHQAEQEKIPLKISPIVKEALKLLRASLPSTIEIRQNIEVKDSVVLADPTQIHQILMNLCTNAAHSMRDRGGVLEVSLVDVVLHSDDIDHPGDLDPGQYTKLTVSDTGHGIEPAIMERIFDPYFTTQEKGKGTGLGLSVVHGIVNTHGGHISVYSEPGKGARFDVFLPLFDSADIKAEIISLDKLAAGDEHILLVDDEKVVVDVVQQMLERLGYQVTVRTSSIEALEVFRASKDKFDLVITDLTMPNMTGDKLAGELMNIRPDIPIIICTGFSEKMSKERAEALGIKGLLMKPIVKSDLAKTVRELIDKS